MKKALKGSSIATKYHYFNLIVRSTIFVSAIVLYITKKVGGGTVEFITHGNTPWYVVPVWLFFLVEVSLRFFPTKLDTTGSKKHFKSQYIPTAKTEPKHKSWKGAAVVAAVWITANGILSALYWFKVIDQGLMILVMLFYSVADMICVLIYCPLQRIFMKNRCCADCRIYNWDFAMMFTPFILIPHIFTWSLLGLALVLLVKWEYTARKHTERFCVNTNSCLTCKNCSEKSCSKRNKVTKIKKINATENQVNV